MRVLKGRTSRDTLVLYNLSKNYRGFFKSMTAVQDISLGVRRGEVRDFCLYLFCCKQASV